MNDLGVADSSTPAVIAALGFQVEIACLREMIANWVAECDGEMRAALEWQFLEGSKYSRPLTVFSCYRAARNGPIPQQIMNSALVIEFFHSDSLIIDDIVDKSPMRGGCPTLHKRFGELSALMTAGYIVADGYARLARDLQAIELFSELLKRLGVAESMQWRLRRNPARGGGLAEDRRRGHRLNV